MLSVVVIITIVYLIGEGKLSMGRTDRLFHARLKGDGTPCPDHGDSLPSIITR